MRRTFVLSGLRLTGVGVRITSVVNKLNTSKVRLEDARDLTKKRMCTFGLHGPWGEGTSVFIRVTFTFPRDYPRASYPNGVPKVNLEKSPLIGMPTYAFILRRLRAIREKERPCLERCLRFLLFGDGEEYPGRRAGGIDSESSSDEEAPRTTRRNRAASFSVLRNDKNLAEPRTSQGVFGPNGESKSTTITERCLTLYPLSQASSYASSPLHRGS